jgi:hypothetical protein
VANHTPGPWKPFRTPRMLHGVMGWRRKVLCRMEDHGVANIEAEAANARLMAAAILYYEATQVMLANEQSGGDGWWRGWELMKEAHAAASGQRPITDEEAALWEA